MSGSVFVTPPGWPIVVESEQTIASGGVSQFRIPIPVGINLLFRAKLEFFAIGPTVDFGIDVRYAIVLRKSDGTIALAQPQTNSLAAGGVIFVSLLPAVANEIEAEYANIAPPGVEDVRGYLRTTLEYPLIPPFAINWP